MREIQLASMATGRSYRMMQVCVAYALAGGNAAMICSKRDEVADKLKFCFEVASEAIKLAGVNIDIVKGGRDPVIYFRSNGSKKFSGRIEFQLPEPWLDWQEMAYMRSPRENLIYKLFVDHQAIEDRFGKMLEEFHRYDLPLEKAIPPAPTVASARREPVTLGDGYAGDGRGCDVIL